MVADAVARCLSHAIDKIDKAIGFLKNGNPNDDWFTLG